MSMTKEAIQHLEKTVLLAAINESLKAIKTKSNLIAVPSDFDLKNLESSMDNRDSYRFNFETKSIPDFSEYCKEFDQDGAKCFINSDNMNARTIFDLGTEKAPLHQRHNAALQLDKTASFKALLKISGQHLSQKDAANFIEDWADNIKVFCREGKSMTINQASLQFREITIEQVARLDTKINDFSEEQSSFEKVEAKNQEKIPAEIQFTCDPYFGLVNREFVMRVSILTGDSKPKISLRIIKLEAHREDMAKEFKQILVAEFEKSKLKTFIGEG